MCRGSASEFKEGENKKTEEENKKTEEKEGDNIIRAAQPKKFPLQVMILHREISLKL